MRRAETATIRPKVWQEKIRGKGPFPLNGRCRATGAAGHRERGGKQ